MYWLHRLTVKLQALVYDILPSTTAVFSYAIGSRKLLANEQFFFVGAQTVVRLLQTTQIISDVCFITDHVAYSSSNNTKIIWIETELFLLFFSFFTRGGCASCLRACFGVRLLSQSYPYQTFRFPTPSSKLCHHWLHHWRGTLCLRAAVHRSGQHPPKGSGTNRTVEAT